MKTTLDQLQAVKTKAIAKLEKAQGDSKQFYQGSVDSAVNAIFDYHIHANIAVSAKNRIMTNASTNEYANGWNKVCRQVIVIAK